MWGKINKIQALSFFKQITTKIYFSLDSWTVRFLTIKLISNNHFSYCTLKKERRKKKYLCFRRVSSGLKVTWHCKQSGRRKRGGVMRNRDLDESKAKQKEKKGLWFTF